MSNSQMKLSKQLQQIQFEMNFRRETLDHEGSSETHQNEVPANSAVIMTKKEVGMATKRDSRLEVIMEDSACQEQ